MQGCQFARIFESIEQRCPICYDPAHMKAIELSKAFDPKSYEDRIYNGWIAKRLFAPAAVPRDGAARFVIVIPPPNVTGVLHMGHGLNNSLQDIVIRYHRMIGDDTLWVPGSDHAGIATQHVVEKELKKRGTSRVQIGREKFVEETWKVTHRHHDIIVNQLKRLGSSCDWERERFTLDEGLSRAVREVFVSLYEKGLIYRGNYLVNWCPSCRTAISDDEVEHAETRGKMYHYRYPLADGIGVHHHCHDPARDHARRHGGGGASRGRALRGARGEDGRAPAHGQADPDHRRCPDRQGVRHRRREGHPCPRPRGQRDRPAPRASADQHPHAGRQAQRERAGEVPRAHGDQGARSGHGGHQGGGAFHQGRRSYAPGRPLLPLQHRDRALPLRPVVRADAAPGRQGAEGVGGRKDPVLSAALGEHLLQLDAQHPRLVHLPPALVGPPHPGLVLRALRRDDRVPPGSDRLRKVRKHEHRAGP